MIEVVLTLMVIAAAVSDLRTRRIPNWIPVSGAALGFALHVWTGGPWGAISSVAGAALGLGIFITLYIAGGMGAGDVKLFSAVGAIVGPHALVYVFIFTGLLGGIAAVVMIFRGRRRMPYGPFIAAGALVYLLSGSVGQYI
jgi:prepilin peptidase CpaA